MLACFRFHCCLQEALQKTDSTSAPQPSTCPADADSAEVTVTTALKSDRTSSSAASERDCILLATDALTACEQSMDGNDIISVYDLFE